MDLQTLQRQKYEFFSLLSNAPSWSMFFDQPYWPLVRCASVVLRVPWKTLKSLMLVARNTNLPNAVVSKISEMIVESLLYKKMVIFASEVIEEGDLDYYYEHYHNTCIPIN
jgi:hypothetical protein